MVARIKKSVAPIDAAVPAEPARRPGRQRQAARGDVAPTQTPAGIESYSVHAAIDAAQEAKMAALRDIINGVPAEESLSMLKGLLKQQRMVAGDQALNPDEELVKGWRDGGYPYKNLMRRRNYEPIWA